MEQEFVCKSCGYRSFDETLPDCPVCGGMLEEIGEGEDFIPRLDPQMEDEENLWEPNF